MAKIPFSDPLATLFLQGSKLYGEVAVNHRLSSVERFNPKNDQWEFVSSMQKKRENHSAAVLNGRIYVCGGIASDHNDLRDCECYDPRSNRWETVAAMKRARNGFNLVAMNGRLYALGGFRDDTVESYDPNTNEWILLEQRLIKTRYYASAAVL